MSIEELTRNLGKLYIREQSEMMDANTLSSVIAAAIKAATDQTRQEFQKTINELTDRLGRLELPCSVKEYKAIEIIDGVQCGIPLDIVKSIPEFTGDVTKYVSWRQAANTAHSLFERYEGSTSYYQAVAIIRNKIIGKADAILSSHNTVLNFKAIIARLDFAFSDKRSIFTLEHEMSVLRQGNKSVVEFYDEVERKLTLIINKVIMTNEADSSLIESLNNKYRQDALRVFISGLKRPVSDTLFSCKPLDLPSALALAQELETNQNRFQFANTYWNSSEKQFSNPNKSFIRPQTQNSNNNSPHYQMAQQTRQNQTWRSAPFGSQAQLFMQQRRVEPMDVDSSLRSRANYNGPPQYSKRPLSMSGTQNPNKYQRVNHLQSEAYPEYEHQYPEPSRYDNKISDPSDNYQTEHCIETSEIVDEVNFLGEHPSYPTSFEH